MPLTAEEKKLRNKEKYLANRERILKENGERQQRQRDELKKLKEEQNAGPKIPKMPEMKNKLGKYIQKNIIPKEVIMSSRIRTLAGAKRLNNYLSNIID